MAPRTRTLAAAHTNPEQLQPPGELVNPESFDDEEGDAFGDLAFFTDAGDEVTWGVERYKTADEIRQNPRGRDRVFVTALSGKVDIVAFQQEHGGGWFRFTGRRADGTYYGHRAVDLAGPRKDYNAQPASPRAIAQPSVNADNSRPPRWARKLYREMKTVQAKLQQPQAAPQAASAPAPATDIGTLFQIADKIASRANPPQDPVEKVAEALLKGIDIGTAREPQAAQAGTDWMAIAKEFAPVIRDLVSTIALTARTRANGRPAPRTAPAGQPVENGQPMGTFDHIPEAVTVEVPPVTKPAEPQISHRWLTAIESLASAVVAGDDPQDFSVTLERILDAQELFDLKKQSPEQVMARLEPAYAMLPVLKTDDAKAFITAVLAELKNPSDES